jgi:uncharacterized RDD family membrane protein YckC
LEIPVWDGQWISALVNILKPPSIGNRVFAFLIYFWIMGCLMAATTLGLGPIFRFNSEFFKTIFPVIMFLYLFGFSFFQEWLLNGRSIGKSIMRIRVIRNNGQPIGFWEAMGRNLLRVIDVYFAGIGLIVMLISRREKRLGDYLAGTLVAYEHRYALPSTSRASAVSAEIPGADQYEPYARRLSPEEYALVDAYLNRKSRLLASERAALENDITGYLAETLPCLPEECKQPGFLENLAHCYRSMQKQGPLVEV